ncbi:hypothetical protein CKALI_04645 [Corynebacterium kalinowskii]|uniref:Uncharacterized protein n=1 Tax=Corynebacterium kalinowskii TaxID=2675216 RepID=A0A6B8VQG9_9CORY|nr:hypothetical protein [Corynebacterium kalinowskii]QGU01807.1 hypothetical protein CKALI_04645 [Corynebacterium kalinowskii]
MAAVISWGLPLAALVWIACEILFSKTRSFASALFIVFAVWLLCMGRVDWLATVPVFLWWIIAVLAGVMVYRSLWPIEGRE